MKYQFPHQKLVMATHNPGKVRELSDLLGVLGLEVISAGELGVIEPEETGTTFEENALLKAFWSYQHTGLASLADDSGLVIPELNGDPGVYSARWAGPDKDFRVAFKRIQTKLGAVHEAAAYFVCVLALVIDEKQVICVRGECHGKVVFPAKGEHGFGYDPIFIKNGMDQTFGEIDPVLKHSISHRAEAFEKIMKIIIN
jgi:XTP/dITP diphosphohydrolase